MHAELGEFLLAIAGVAGTLLGTFIVGVFFYLDLAHYRSATSDTTPKDRYMRAAVRWVFVNGSRLSRSSSHSSCRGSSPDGSLRPLRTFPHWSS